MTSSFLALPKAGVSIYHKAQKKSFPEAAFPDFQAGFAVNKQDNWSPG